MRKVNLPGAGLVLATLTASSLALGWTPKSTASDALIRLPGSQPLQLPSLQNSAACSMCHAGYDPNHEQQLAWRGSMMAQSARDPLFWAAMTVAVQDSIYAFGRPNATDTCERCHLPRGWLQLRSEPTNGSKFSSFDFDGVDCDTCHKMVDPHFADTHAGTREGNDWMGYWDEAVPADATMASDATYQADLMDSKMYGLFDGKALYDANGHFNSPGFDQAGNAEMFVASGGQKRGPYIDGNGMHARLYSRFHKSKYFCATCHDISNNAFDNAAYASLNPGDGSTVLPSESTPVYALTPLERTFSEFILSDFGKQGGAAGTGAFAPGTLTTRQPGNLIATCQDCHVPLSTGYASNDKKAPLRPGGPEHPRSGDGVHELTGGNAWIPFVLATTAPASPVFDAMNAQILGQGPQKLTLDLMAGSGVDWLALLAGRNRALKMLSRAADIQNVVYDPATGALSFRVQNHTGHKLITGYADGRRMFVDVKAFKAGALVHEINPYDAAAGTLRGLPLAESPNSPPLGPNEEYQDALVYESRLSSSVTGEAKSFHFALTTGVFKDNRVPPQGFRIGEAAARKAEPSQNGATAPGMFTAAEYQGGYDDVSLMLPPGADSVSVELYYQTTSREYAEFLRDEINGAGTTLKSPTPSGEANAYVAQTDMFFSQLAAWGDAYWQLWSHNKDVPGAAPILMTRGGFAIASPCQGKPDGTGCDDGDACTDNDVCNAGACAGTKKSCDDGNACTDDSCDPQSGCKHDFNQGGCEDGNLCTAGDTCAFGVCVAGPGVSCDDKDPCTIDSCDPMQGCVHKPAMTPMCGAGGQGGGGGQGGAATSSSSTSSSTSSSGASSSGSTSSGQGGQSSSGAGGQGAQNGGSSGGCGCALFDAGDTRGAAIAVALLALGAGARRRRRGARRP